MPRSRINSRARLMRFGYSSGGIGAIAPFCPFSSHRRPPFSPTIGSTVDHVEEILLNGGCQRTALAIADLAIVDLDNRRHLGTGAGEKRLVGREHIIAGEQFLAYFDVLCSCNTDDRITGDAVE